MGKDDTEVGATLRIEHDGFGVQRSWHRAACKLECQCSGFVRVKVSFC